MKLQMDKIAHFGVGGLISAVVTIMSILQEGCPSTNVLLMIPFIGHAVTFILSVMKEYVIDDNKNWKDILAAMIGSAVIHGSVGVGVLLNTLSK